MAGLGGDSWQHYTTLEQKCDSITSSGGASIDPTGGPRGGPCLKWDGSGGNFQAFRSYPTTKKTVIHQFRFKRTGTGPMKIFSLLDNGTIQMSMWLGSDNFIRCYRWQDDGGFQLGMSTNPILGNAWNYIKCKLTVDNSSGVLEVIINESSQISFAGDTQRTGNAYVTHFMFGHDTTHASVLRWADHLYMDDSGDQNNDFIPDQAVDALFADDAGAYSEWGPTSSPSSPNFEHINEYPPNGDISFVDADADGLRDAYKYPDVGAGNIAMILINMCCKKTEDGTLGIASLRRSNSMDEVGETLPVPDDYHILQQVSELSPDTGDPWSISELNDSTSARAQFGQKAVTL